MSSDIESTFITAATASATAISTAAGVGNNAALTLTASPYVTDAARKITITCAGNSSAITFNIIGLDHLGNAATENLAGTNTNISTSVGYWTSITSITAVGNPTGNVSAGTSNSVAAPIFGGRLRLKGLYAVNTATAGTITFRETSPTGTIRMQFATLGSANSSEYPDVPDDGIVFKDGGYVEYSPVNMSSITVFYA